MHSRILVGVGVLGLVGGCGVFGSDASSPPAAVADPGPSMGADDGGTLPEGAPPPVIGTPANNELTNEFGVFVSTTAAAGGDGTIEHPFATISAGIDRVKDLKLRVYVCAGTYKESLTLVNAVSVIGALSCDGGVWATGGARAVLEAPTTPAIRAKDIALTTRFEGFDVTAPAGTAMSPSSIALIAQNASMLTFANTKLSSAKAFDGVDGADATQLTAGTTLTGKNGLPFNTLLANPMTGPVPQLGQAGGVGSCVGAPGHDGENGKQGGTGAVEICTAFTHIATGIKDWHWDFYVRNGAICNRSDGVPGTSAAGNAGPDGASATTYGSFTPEGYSPLDGTAGADGAPGHGGSGGNAAPTTAGVLCGSANEGKIIYDASGGGGGAGGCPGLAGKPGGGGGASIAALVFASPGLSVTTCELVAGDGGKGGKGAFPSSPTPGGSPGGAPTDTTSAVAGTSGGTAGFSGNGAGGPSVALAYTGGDLVVAQDTHLTPGTAGAGVAARTNATTNVTIPASPAGPSVATLPF
jgi:hypothetical protein